jgi:hypothetical protein
MNWDIRSEADQPSSALLATAPNRGDTEAEDVLQEAYATAMLVKV